jgi:hypothetical protein
LQLVRLAMAAELRIRWIDQGLVAEKFLPEQVAERPDRSWPQIAC